MRSAEIEERPFQAVKSCPCLRLCLHEDHWEIGQRYSPDSPWAQRVWIAGTWFYWSWRGFPGEYVSAAFWKRRVLYRWYQNWYQWYLLENDIQVLNLIHENLFITQAELKEKMQVSIITGKRLMADLQKRGVIERQGSSRRGKWIIISQKE